MIITIDGPSGVGKGTVAKIISKKLNINYLDSGAMYRALALYADMHNIKENDLNKLKKLLIDIHIQFINEDGVDKVYLNTEDVNRPVITLNSNMKYIKNMLTNWGIASDYVVSDTEDKYVAMYSIYL